MSRRLKKEKEGDNELQYIIDPNMIDDRFLERTIQIFGSYKRYKDKKTRHETKLQMTSIKRTRPVTSETTKIYCTTTESEIGNNWLWYSAGMRIITVDIDEMKTYKINLKCPRESADLLTVIEALKLKRDISIKTNRTDSITDIKQNIKKWEKEDFLQKEDNDMWRELACYIHKHEGQIIIEKAKLEEDKDNIKQLIKTPNTMITTG